MSKLKSPQEMEHIREADAKLREKQLREFVPERNISKALAYFEIGRYTSGNFRGLFTVHQMITEDALGKPLKKPIRKTVADGVDMVVAITSLENAIRRRVYK